MYQSSLYPYVGRRHCEQKAESASDVRLPALLEIVRNFHTIALGADGPEDMFLALLVAATAGQGLGLNRSFFLRYSEVDNGLHGAFAVGPATIEEAQELWAYLSRTRPSFNSIYERVKSRFPGHDRALNQVVQEVTVSLEERENPLAASLLQKEAFCVGRSQGCLFQWRQQGLDKVFSPGGFVVAPVVANSTIFGVVVGDNAITRLPLERYHVDGLALLAEMAGAWALHLAKVGRLKGRLRELEEERYSLAAAPNMVIETERMNAVGQMVEQLSHHIRNPLSVLGGMVRRLDAKIDEPEARVYIDQILKQAQRVEESLNSLFCFSTSPELNLRPGRVSEVVRRSAASLGAIMRARDINWHLCVKGEEPTLMIDDSRLREAFINIIKNGIEAMPEGGIIFVTITPSEHSVEVQVADTGVGLIDVYIDRACEPFFSMKNRGLGLGLSIARQIVEAHKGALEVRRNRFGGVTVKAVFSVGEEHGAA